MSSETSLDGLEAQLNIKDCFLLPTNEESEISRKCLLM